MPKLRLQFDGDNTGIEKEARTYSLTQSVEDKLDSISVIENDIDDLQDQINNLASRGRYLSTWNCVTGLPDTNPPVDPYVYRAGDYYIVSTVGGTNYRPVGSEYHSGVQSQATESQAVSQNDLYIYDGIQWVLQQSGSSLYAVWGSITGTLSAQTDLQTALDAKANKTDVLEKTNTTSYTPTADYHPATKKYADDNDTFIGATAPTNNVIEGRLWYDTTADVLKVYNGGQWVPTGKTYTAGSHIEISNADVISTTGLQEELTAGDNITIEDVCTTESDMKGPCPKGFHVPTNGELGSIINIWVALGGGSADVNNFCAALKMPLAGKIYSNGLYYRNVTCSYRTSIFSPGSSYDYANVLKIDSQYSGRIDMSQENTYVASSIRPFKNNPIVPDNNWTKLYGTSIETGGIFWNSADGLISLSSDGQNWITMADKNLGATTVWNSGDTLNDDNCGNYFQRGNNYGFPSSGYQKDTQTIDTTGYGPGNYYIDNIFHDDYTGRFTPVNTNLRGGQTQGTFQDCDLTISAEDTTYSAGTGINISANNEISNTGVISTNNTYDNIIYLSQSDYDNLQNKEANTLYCTPDTPDVPAVSDVAYDNTWDGVTTIAPSKNAVYDKINSDLNTKTFYLSSTSDLTTAQAAYDWYNLGRNSIISYNNYTYILANTTSSRLTFKGGLAQQNQNSSSFTGQDVIYIDFSSDVVTSVSTDTAVVAGSYLRLGQNYATPYIPTYDGEPCSKKYTDEHGPNIPVYSYHGDFSTSVSCDVNVGGDYKIVVTGHHGSTIDRDVVVTVDGVQAASYTSNVIENFCYICVVSPTGGTGSSIVITKSSNTSFTIYDVYIEKISKQSGYLTVTTS